MLLEVENAIQKRFIPSLFGIYPVLQEGERVHVWGNVWFTCQVSSLASIEAPLVLEINTAPGFAQKITVTESEDSEKYRDILLSRWMKSGAASIPSASPVSVLALIVSQLPGTPMPVWDNAPFSQAYWEKTLAKAGPDSNEQSAHIIVEALIQETPLLSMLEHSSCVESVISGLASALPGDRAPLATHITSIVNCIHQKPGHLLLADSTQSHKELTKIPDIVKASGYIVLCGERPAELQAMQLAMDNQIPVLHLDAQKLKRATWLRHIDHTTVIGRPANLGVLRQRAFEQHKEARQAGGESHAEPV